MKYKRLIAYAFVAILGAFTGNIAVLTYGTHLVNVEVSALSED